MPTSYAEMFDFNATVMGFGKHKWLAEVNRSFDDIAKNAAKLDRLQEETEVPNLDGQVNRFSQSQISPKYHEEWTSCFRGLQWSCQQQRVARSPSNCVQNSFEKCSMVVDVRDPGYMIDSIHELSNPGNPDLKQITR